MGIAERRLRQKDEVRSSILATAWQVVKKEGWQSLSIRKIADASRSKGLSVRICEEALYGDSIQGSYLEAMQHNADVIARGLTQ
jgi:DNA-binding transcriptional regulator YbjK